MKLSDQPYTHLQIPSAQPGTQGGKAPIVTDKQQDVASGLRVERDLGNESGRSSQYPMASEEEVQARAKRASSVFFNNPKTKAPKKKPPANTKPPAETKPPSTKPPKPAGGPNGSNDAVNSSKTISDLHKKNVLPPISSELASGARSAFINHGVSTLTGLPFTAGEHIASCAITDRIDAQAKMPGAEKRNADGRVSTNDPSATEQQKLDARLESAEIKTEVMVNSILSINEGPDAKAVGKDPGAATDVDSRLNALESRMNATEDQMKEIAKRYGLIYDPYVAPESSETPTAASRMAVVEKRYEHMNKMLKRLIRNAQADAEDAE
ncbi:hypothetical protein [Pseudomonas sp. CBZ-4]|uniref:hypothetical protein n=1 Tax=Pseudomonas sp. CBZ-4 TaxID=1163065 RepID=UPI000381C1BA|nr:hypothetical protein [Pseudomonas sp. CBZ-4]